MVVTQRIVAFGRKQLRVGSLNKRYAEIIKNSEFRRHTGMQGPILRCMPREIIRCSIAKLVEAGRFTEYLRGAVKVKLVRIRHEKVRI